MGLPLRLLRPALLALMLPGCVGFHPLNPPWRQLDESGEVGSADQTSASGVGRQVDAQGQPVSTKMLEPLWRMIGQSVKGRPVRATTVGHGPRRVLWIGGIHGDECEGSVATQRLPGALTVIPGALSEVTLTILQDANPDGTAMNMRRNANGVDLNRNFPAANFKPHRLFGTRPLSQPESQLVHDLIASSRPHLVIVAHSWRGARFINYDGPAEDLAMRFSRLSGYPVRDSRDLDSTPGSLGAWVGHSLGIPILTLEYWRGREPWAAWLETKDAILAVVLNA